VPLEAPVNKTVVIIQSDYIQLIIIEVVFPISVQGITSYLNACFEGGRINFWPRSSARRSMRLRYPGLSISWTL